MKRKTFLSILTLAAVIFLPALARAANASIERRSAPALVSPATDDDDIEEVEAGAPDLRVVTAAPRAAITGRIGSVLTRARMGRTLNVVAGETVRFVSGVKEAVWYQGAGSVESILTILGDDPNGQAAPLGRDRVILGGAAPQIDSARARVDVTFGDLGVFPVTAVVRVSSIPRGGRTVRRADRVPYSVHVWNAGDLGGIEGTVTDVSDASPLVGFRVVALDPSDRSLVSAGYTNCDGSYTLKRLPPGDYLVAVRGNRGFAGEFFDDAPDASTAMPVAVSAGVETPSIDFQLAR